jgi:hypothetical protein
MRGWLLALALLLACRDQPKPPEPPASAEHVIEFTLERVAQPDTVLGGIRDVGFANGYIWLVAVGTTPAAHYDLETLQPSYPGRDLTKGPLPIRQLYSLDVAQDGALVVWDGDGGRLLHISPKWELRAIASSSDLFQTPQTPGWDFLGGKRNQLFVLEDGYLLGKLPSSKNGSGDLDRTRWVLARGMQRDTVIQFSDEMIGFDSVLAGPRLFGPFPLVARCGRRGAAVYFPKERRIAILDSAWRQTRQLRVKRAPPERTPKMAQELFLSRMLISAQGRIPEPELRKTVESAPIGALAEAARLTPAYSRLICTPAGTVLIERFRIATLAHLEPNIWEVYRADGSHVLLQVPEQFRLFDADDEHLVGIVLDSLDVPSVARGRWPQ